MAKISIEKHRSDIQEFKLVEDSYKQYATTLKAILEKARNIYAPLGFVEARTKKIESFSEKIIRKDKYENPLIDMTDLCGARVITHFSRQVHDICHFIEQNFDVDRENSVDVKTRLQISEFGYRSIHYIVTIRKSNILGVDIPESIRGLKAEIQVRTFHEHIWADIIHDRIYKSSINVTDEWKRESARLAALLEEADNAFAGISGTIDQLATNYQATPDPQKLKNEIDILDVLIKLNSGIDNKNAELRLKLSRIYNLSGEWSSTADLLKPTIDTLNLDETIYAGILREYGYALCHLHNKKFENEGIARLKNAIAYFEEMPTKNNELALTYKYMADVNAEESLGYITKTHKLTPENPYYFANLLVEHLAVKNEISAIDLDLLSSKMNDALKTFNQHIGLGIEVLAASLNVGKILFLQSSFTESVDTYVNLVKMVLYNQTPFSKEALLRELNSLDKISKLNPYYSNSIKGLLHLMLWLKYDNKESHEFLLQFRSNQSYEQDDVIIIAGISQKPNNAEFAEYKIYLSEVLRDFSGSVISSGAITGLYGLLGNVIGEKKESGTKIFRAIGYLPNAKEVNGNFDCNIRTKSENYSILEPLSYWVDILLSNTNPNNVIVVGINGDEISSLEYKMALAFGAKVCLAGKTGGAAQTVVFDQNWKNLSNLYNIPNDPCTLWAIANFNKRGTLNSEEINQLAPKMHEFYRAKRLSGFNSEKETDINKYRVMMEWDKLSPALQKSNIRQVAFMEHIFNRGGFVFRKSDNLQKLVVNEQIVTLDLMAQLEHGRWNAERLMDGWRFGQKDVLNKRTPYLVAWNDLDYETKSYDYDPIKNFPEILLQIGYEVVKA